MQIDLADISERDLERDGLAESGRRSDLLSGARPPEAGSHRLSGYRRATRAQACACWFVGDGGSREHLGANSVDVRPVLVASALLWFLVRRRPPQRTERRADARPRGP